MFDSLATTYLTGNIPVLLMNFLSVGLSLSFPTLSIIFTVQY